MKTNDQELKRAYREYVQNTSGTRGGNCPGPEEIWSLFSGRVSGKRRARMVDHITACSSCFREFEAFLEISRAEGNLAREVQSRFRSQPRRIPLPMVWRYVTALLIFIVVLAAVMLSTRWLGPAKQAEERGRLSGQLRLLAPGQKPPLRAPLIFRWEEIARSEYYIIEIFDDSLLPFWKSSRLMGNSFELPSPVKEKLERRKRYFWMLTAFSQGGTKTESALEEFSLID
jgi:hypothetical protein